MLDNNKLCSDMVEVANLPLRRKALAIVWGWLFGFACSFGLISAVILVAVICDAIPVLLKHYFG